MKNGSKRESSWEWFWSSMVYSSTGDCASMNKRTNSKQRRPFNEKHRTTTTNLSLLPFNQNSAMQCFPPLRNMYYQILIEVDETFNYVSQEKFSDLSPESGSFQHWIYSECNPFMSVTFTERHPNFPFLFIMEILNLLLLMLQDKHSILQQLLALQWNTYNFLERNNYLCPF